jgi:hypothetical protein
MEINLGNTVPLFAHDVAFSTITKTTKSKEGKIRKEQFTELVFIDSVRKTAIARIMLPKSTFRELPKRINETLKKLKEDINSQDIPQEAKAEIKTTGSYLG